MKLQIMLVSLLLVSFTSLSQAGFNDPWYLQYRVSGGTIVKLMGPYQNEFECSAARFQLPFGAEFLGCVQ